MFGSLVSRETHEQALARSVFAKSAILTRGFSEEHNWTLDTLIGYLYSTSFASKTVLGASVELFEASLKKALLEYSPSENYRETIETTVILVKKAGI